METRIGLVRNLHARKKFYILRPCYVMQGFDLVGPFIKSHIFLHTLTCSFKLVQFQLLDRRVSGKYVINAW